MKQSPFRSIRQKLFNEGKLLRYLGYALGEILLIVVGILLALKINDWNEDKKAQAQYDLYITQLKADLQLAIENIDDAAKNAEQHSRRDYSIIQFLEGYPDEEIDTEAFEEALRLLNRINPLDVRIGYLGRLLEGEFETIERNRSLANEALIFQKDFLLKLGVIDRVISNRDIPDQIVRRYWEGPIRSVPGTKMQYNLERMKSSEEFQWSVRALARAKMGYHRNSMELKGILEQFLAVLEEYE